MIRRAAVHATFTITRASSAPPARVFAAFSTPQSKAKRFVDHDNWDKSDHQLDFRVGGVESVSGGPPGRPTHAYNGTICDIVDNERVVVSYEMHMDDVRISVSLGATEIKANGTASKLIYTEQGGFLDGYDDAGSRERGANDLFDQLGAFVVN